MAQLGLGRHIVCPGFGLLVHGLCTGRDRAGPFGRPGGNRLHPAVQPLLSEGDAEARRRSWSDSGGVRRAGDRSGSPLTVVQVVALQFIFYTENIAVSRVPRVFSRREYNTLMHIQEPRPMVHSERAVRGKRQPVRLSLVLALAVGGAAIAMPATARADAVLTWNNALLDAIRSTSPLLVDGPPEVAREM